MAVCTACDREMLGYVPCSLERLLLVDGSYERRRVGGRGVSNCGDCGAPRGGLHHPGCDMERCPRCRGQLIMCGCWDDLESAAAR